MIEQDYLMRLIKDITKLLTKLMLHRETESIDISQDDEQTENHFLYKKLIHLADNGKINEAENLLYDIDTTNLQNYEVVLAFYTYLNDYPDDYLKECNFTRQEIESGLHDLSKKFGVPFYDSISRFLNFNDS